MVIELERNENDTVEPLRVYLREIGRASLLTLRQEADLAKRIRAGDEEAREEMIKANLRLVVRIAHDFENLGLPLLDLISEGNIGLMTAVDRYDPAHGAKLSTYAAWWIKQAIRRALCNCSRTIRLPVHIVDKLRRFDRLRDRLTDEFGRAPTDIEMADRCHIPTANVARLRTLGQRPASLDAPIGDDDDSPLGDIIEDDAAATPHQMLRSKAIREEIRDHIKHLTPREAEILTLRFGMDGGGRRTLEVVGRKFRVTRERIRQLEAVALTKLRRCLESLDHHGWKADHGN